MSATLNISSANYYMVIVPLNGRIHFIPCILLTRHPFNSDINGKVNLQIKDSCVTNRNQDEIFSIGEHYIDDYINRGGTEDCIFVDNLIDKIFQASTDQSSQSDNNLLQLFMDYAILQAIKTSGAHQDINEEVLESWIYVIVTPIGWGKRIGGDVLFSVFAESRFIAPSSALVMTAFDTLLSLYLCWDLRSERSTFLNSKNMLCALSVGKNEDASLSMNIFSITKSKGTLGGFGYLNIDSSLCIPTVFSNNRIQINAGYKNLMALLRDAVKEKIGLSAHFCNELLNQICSFLTKFEREYQERGSKRLDQIYPFQTTEFAPTITEQDIAGLRLITLMDIYAALSSQWELIMLEIQAAIEKEQCLTGVFFIVIPEDPHLYPDPIENTLFICIVLMKFKLKAASIKKFRYLYDNYSQLCCTEQRPYEPIDGHMWNTNAGVAIKLGEEMSLLCQKSLPLSSLPRLLNDKSNIDTINYVYLSTNQVVTQSVSVNENGTPNRLRSQKSDIITLDRFLVLDDKETKSEETLLRFYLSGSALSLLESMFPKMMHEFATLYRKPKEKPTHEKDVTDVSCLNLENWYSTLHRKYQQLFFYKAGGHGLDYTKFMTDLVHYQSKSDSPRIHITQQKYIGVLLTVYFGYLKEMVAKDFGQDTRSTRYILIFEQLMKTITIGSTDDTLMREALHQCGWVSITEESKRKVMVYDIEDNFPISECLQNEGIRMIPAEKHFAVVTMTRYYVKICVFQALEDILPADKYYNSLKMGAHTYAFDYYEMICEKIWQHVLESIYETDCLLEYPSNMDVMDIEFTLKSYSSFKVAFTEYILNEFPFAYASKPAEKHRFPLYLKQDDCNIILTNRLVLHAGVLPTVKFLLNTTTASNLPPAFMFLRPSNFDDEKNQSLPMLGLLETELKKLLEIRFKKMIRISERQFGSVHSHPCLKLISGDFVFGYEALKTGVVRGVETNNFALGFQYFDDDEASFVEVIHNQSGPARFIQGTEACIITKIGAPFDNSTKHHSIPHLGFKIPDIKKVSKAILFKMDDTLQRNVGDIVSIKNYDHTILSVLGIHAFKQQKDVESFMYYPYVYLSLLHSSEEHGNAIMLVSAASNIPIMDIHTIQPLKVAYFDSYEEKPC